MVTVNSCELNCINNVAMLQLKYSESMAPESAFIMVWYDLFLTVVLKCCSISSTFKKNGIEGPLPHTRWHVKCIEICSTGSLQPTTGVTTGARKFNAQTISNLISSVTEV